MEIIRTIKGVNGQVELYSEKIIIKRKGALGFLTQGLKGAKTVPFSSITSIQIKEAGLLTNGYIQFGLHGGNESRGGIWSAVKDENSIMFTTKTSEDVHFVKDYIETHRSGSVSGHVGVADELSKFKKLLDEGVISKADFEKQKDKILK